MRISPQLVIKKTAAGLFLWPMADMLHVAFVNNLPSIADSLLAIAFITVGSLGLPIWMLIAAKRMYCLEPRGDKLVRRLSVILFVGYLGLFVFGSMLSPDLLCSDDNTPECIARVEHRPMFNALAIGIAATYLFTFGASFIKLSKHHV